MIKTQYINLDMTPSGILPVLYCSQYDVGRPLGMVVYNGGESVDLSTYTCTIEATRTDGTAITAAVTVDGNIAAFVTTATMTNQADRYQAKLVIVDGSGNRVASLAFVMMVTPATMDENAESIEEDRTLYQQYTETVKTLIADVRANLATETVRAKTAESALQANINTEVAARKEADTAEASARTAAINAVRTDLAAESSIRAAKDASLQSQINQYVTPSTQQPDEVVNARVGANGFTYDTLGNAVRGQVKDLSTSIHDASTIESINIFTGLTWEQGAINSSGADLDGTGGSYLTHWIRTVGFYPASMLSSILGGCSTGLGTGLAIYCAQYGSDHSFIQYNLRNIAEGESASTAWDLEDTCTYVRFTASKIPTSSNLPISAETDAQYIQLNATSRLSTEVEAKMTIRDEKIGINQRLINGLKDTNSFNIIDNATLAGKTSGGITWTVNENGSVTANGTASSTSLFDIYSDTVPDWIELGVPYIIEYDAQVVDFRVLYNDGTATTNINSFSVHHLRKSIVTIPTNAVRVILRLTVSSGATANETVLPKMYRVPTNADLADIPLTYYVPEIEQTISEVMDANTEPGLVLFWCSDLHYRSMIGSYPATLVKTDSVTDMVTNMINVGKTIKADGLVCLGDVVDGGASSSSTYTTAQTKAQIRYVMEQLKRTGLPLLYALGNHDDNRYVTGEAFTAEQLYAMFMSYCPTERVSDYSFHGLNFYIDYPEYKIRALIVDESDYYDNNWHYGYNAATIAWFQNQLAAIPSGWSVIVFTHRGFVQGNNEGGRWHVGQEDMYNAVQSFINGGGNYIATIYGHSHVDYSNSTPWLEIAIGSAKPHNMTPGDTYPTGSVNPNREKGTYTEDLWDVLIIQPNSRKIKTIRFGAGNNREWTY